MNIEEVRQCPVGYALFPVVIPISDTEEHYTALIAARAYIVKDFREIHFGGLNFPCCYAYFPLVVRRSFDIPRFIIRKSEFTNAIHAFGGRFSTFEEAQETSSFLNRHIFSQQMPEDSKEEFFQILEQFRNIEVRIESLNKHEFPN